MELSILDSAFFKALMERLCELVRKLIKEELDSINTEELMNKREAAEFLRVSTLSLSKYTDNGIIPAYQLGGRILYKKSELLSNLERKPYLKSV